ncbi:hypothetical protein ACH46N_06670 [Streptomyces pristinaespiralis]|nr:hypothetical protein [Streptomyces pristinaespiralis]
MTATSTLARCDAYDATERIGAHLTSDCSTWSAALWVHLAIA